MSNGCRSGGSGIRGIGGSRLAAGDRYTTALALVEKLELAEIKGELKQQITALQKFDLLIIDELGYLPMNRQARYNLFQLVNALYRVPIDDHHHQQGVYRLGRVFPQGIKPILCTSDTLRRHFVRIIRKLNIISRTIRSLKRGRLWPG